MHRVFRAPSVRFAALSKLLGPAPGWPALRLLGAALAWAGVLGILGLGALDGARPSGSVASGAVAALVAAVCLGAFTTLLSSRGSEDDRRTIPSSPAGPRRALGGWGGAITVALVATLAVQTWFAPGGAIAGGDLTPPYGLAWIGRLFSPWVWTGANLGGPGALEFQAPWAAVLIAVHAVGGSAPVAQRLWLSLLFAGAGLGAYALLRLLRLSTVASVVGALLYLFNGYTVSNVGASAVYICGMLILAGYPAVVLAVASGRWRLRTGVAAMLLGVPFVGYSYQNPPLVLMVAAATVLAVPAAWYVYGGPALRRGAWLLAGASPLLVLGCAYWLVPAWFELHSVPTSQLAPVASWAWTESRASLANGLWLNTAWGWRYPAYFSYASLYHQLPLSLLKFLLPAAAFTSLGVTVFARRGSAHLSRLAVGTAAATLTLVIFSTGTLPPGSLLFDPLYHLPYGWVLQGPGRFLMAAALGYAVLVGVTVTAVQGLVAAVDMRVTALGGQAILVWKRLGVAVSGDFTTAIALVALVPAFPLFNGAVVPGPRGAFPSSHVSMPGYWKTTAAYLNRTAPNATVLVLPPEDFYQMPYTWYYGNDGFISDMLDAHVIDPSGQGYTATSGYLETVSEDISASLLAQDWPLAERLLGSLGVSEILLRGDVEPGFPGRHIISPKALAQALSRDPLVSLVRHDGPLRIYRVRSPRPSVVSSPSIATVNSTSPDPRVLALLPPGTALVTGPPRAGLPTVLTVPPLSGWQLSGRSLTTTAPIPTGWRYRLAELAPISARSVVAEAPSPLLTPPFTAQAGRDRNGPFLRINLPLGPPLLANGNFRRGKWDPVGNCDAYPGTLQTAHLAARVLRAGGPEGLPVLELSAQADAACEAQTSTWRSGPVLLSLWTRHVSGSRPAICVWEAPLEQCAPLELPAPRNGWAHFQAVVTPPPGTKNLSLLLYAYGPGVDEYAGVTLASLPSADLPVVIGTPTGRAPASTKLLVNEASYAPGWSGPSGATYVRVDGLRGGWLGSAARGEASVYFAPGFADFWLGVVPTLAAGAILIILVSLRPAGVARVKFRWRGKHSEPVPGRPPGDRRL